MVGQVHGACSWIGPDPKGEGGGLYGPQNGGTEQGASSALEVP